MRKNEHKACRPRGVGKASTVYIYQKFELEEKEGGLKKTRGLGFYTKSLARRVEFCGGLW